MITPEAEVISLCDRLIALQAAREASSYQDATLEPIDTDMSAAFDRLTDLPITTAAGAQAVARAALALATHTTGGAVVCGNEQAECLALNLAEFIAAPTVPIRPEGPMLPPRPVPQPLPRPSGPMLPPRPRLIAPTIRHI